MSAPSGPDGARILLVDDARDEVDLITLALVRQGWKVQAAARANEGLARLAERRYDLVIAHAGLDVAGADDQGRGEDDMVGFGEIGLAHHVPLDERKPLSIVFEEQRVERALRPRRRRRLRRDVEHHLDDPFRAVHPFRP